MSFKPSAMYPAGSTGRLRADALAVLGILKVATAEQIQRLVRPGAASNKALRAALLDLARHGLTLSEGQTAQRHKLWRLTPAGLEAAAEVLPTGTELGGTARGAARTGAPHAMAVNETILGFLRPTPEATGLEQLDDDTDQEAGQLPGQRAGQPVPAGIGSLYSWATEVVHPISQRERVIADAVLQAPEDGLPVLIVELDRGTMSPERIAAKFERYQGSFRRTQKGPDGKPRPYWRSMYPDTGREGPPPVAIVYTGAGPRGLLNRMNAVQDLSRPHWSGTTQRPGGYYAEERDHYVDYSDAIPIIATTLTKLQESGPRNPIWWRHGHARWETLEDALTNHNDEAAYELREEKRRQRWEEKQRRKEEERKRDMEAWKTEQEEALAQARAEEAARIHHCARCGKDLDEEQFAHDPDAPPPDGQNCARCRYQIAWDSRTRWTKFRHFLDGS